MNKSEILKSIADYVFYEKDYDIAVQLLERTEPNLFVKILEEIFKGNLYFGDFEDIFTDKLSDGLRDEIKTQVMLEDRMNRYISFRNIMNITSNIDNTIGITSDSKIYKNIVNEEKLDRFFDLVSTAQADDTFTNTLISKIIQNEEEISNIVMSRGDYMIPLQYDDIKITDNDRNYMLVKNITEADMKKMKSLATYMYFVKNKE